MSILITFREKLLCDVYLLKGASSECGPSIIAIHGSAFDERNSGQRAAVSWEPGAVRASLGEILQGLFACDWRMVPHERQIEC